VQPRLDRLQRPDRSEHAGMDVRTGQELSSLARSQPVELPGIELGPQTVLSCEYIPLQCAKVSESNVRDLRIYRDMLMASTRPAVGRVVVSLRRATLGTGTPGTGERAKRFWHSLRVEGELDASVGRRWRPGGRLLSGLVVRRRGGISGRCRADVAPAPWRGAVGAPPWLIRTIRSGVAGPRR
jgi:hypothetical protein